MTRYNQLLTVKMRHAAISTLFLFSLIVTSILYGMEEPTFLSFLPREIRAKIFACADLQSKNQLKTIYPQFFLFDSQNLISHSPLILSREDCLFYMIENSKKNNRELFYNLLSNVTHCDYADIFTIIPYFLEYDSEMLPLLNKYTLSGDNTLLKQLLPHIMTIYKGEKETIDSYLMKHIEYPEEKIGVNPLNVVIHYQHPIGIAELLIAQNKELINTPSHDGWTPLADAVHSNNQEMCHFLLSQNGTALDMRIESDSTVLHIAAQNNNIPIAQLLLDHGCNINALNENSETPLLLASYEGHTVMATFLLEHHADIEIASSTISVPFDSVTPLSAAIMSNHLPTINLLIDYGANLESQSIISELTPLLVAVDIDNYDAAALLLQRGANVNAADCYGYTPLILAAHKNNLDMVKLLLCYDIDLNHKTTTGRTALSYAIANRNWPIAHLLIKHPASSLNNEEIDSLEKSLMEI